MLINGRNISQNVSNNIRRDINSNKTTLKTLKDDVLTATSQSISDSEESINQNLATALQTVDDNILNLTNSVDLTVSDVTQSMNDLETALTSSLTTLQSDVESNTTSVDTALTAITTINGNISDINTQISTVQLSASGDGYSYLTNDGTYSNTYYNFNPIVMGIGTEINYMYPQMIKTLTADTTFTHVNLNESRSALFKLRTGGFTPTFPSGIIWPEDNEPSWADYNYWIISLSCASSTTVTGVAVGYTLP